MKQSSLIFIVQLVLCAKIVSMIDETSGKKTATSKSRVTRRHNLNVCILVSPSPVG